MKKYIVEINNERTVRWFDFETKKYHREDGPAIIWSDGSKEWRINGHRHRTDGPAVEFPNGDKEWYIEGKLHRTDGPAVKSLSGDKWWFIDGIEYTEEEFNKITNSCNGKEVEIDGKKYKLTLCE